MKTANYITRMILFSFICLIMTSCGGYSVKSAKELCNKYNETGKLTEAEYSDAIDLMQTVYEARIKGIDRIIDNPEDEDKISQEFKEKYEYSNELEKIIDKASASDMGEANMARWKEIKGEFTKQIKQKLPEIAAASGADFNF